MCACIHIHTYMYMTLCVYISLNPKGTLFVSTANLINTLMDLPNKEELDQTYYFVSISKL